MEDMRREWLTKGGEVTILETRLVVIGLKDICVLLDEVNWRDVRVVEGSSFENCRGASLRGFESLSLRNNYRLSNEFLGEVREWPNRAPC